ncbi:MAG: ABC transporter ATP-binding protein [Anaerolineae bacterium]
MENTMEKGVSADQATGRGEQSVAHNLIETRALTKRYPRASGYRALLPFGPRNEITVVDQVYLQVRQGELLGLLGPNGAGKTTLVKMLCTLVLPSAGQGSVAGHDIAREAGRVRSQVGLIDCQERSFFWRLSGRQNLDYFAALQGLHGNRAATRINEVLELVHLAEDADRRFMTYSSGMRQRLALARGLLVMPQVLFVDEATRALDPQGALDLRTFARRTLVEDLGCTVVWVTHRMEEVEGLCDRVAIMSRGRLIACGPVKDISQRLKPGHVYEIRVRGLSAAACSALQTIQGVRDVAIEAYNGAGANLRLHLSSEDGALSDVLAAILAHGGRIERCSVCESSLEDIFLQVIKEDEYAAHCRCDHPA